MDDKEIDKILDSFLTRLEQQQITIKWLGDQTASLIREKNKLIKSGKKIPESKINNLNTKLRELYARSSFEYNMLDKLKDEINDLDID